LQDPEITEYLRKMEGKKRKMVVSSSSDQPPAYTPSGGDGAASMSAGKCCMETESRLRAEFAVELQRVKDEHARELQNK
jgi:hypothetical protein